MKVNKENIKTLFAQFSDTVVLIIGDVMLDDYILGNVSRISPEAPVPVVDIKKRYVCLGGAANVALNIQSLGAKPILCSVIGQDRKSADFLETMNNEQLSTEGIIQSPNRIMTTKYRAIGNNMQLLRLDSEITHNLIEEDEQNFLNSLSHIINNQKVSAIIFEDYDKGVITSRVIREIVSLADKKAIPIMVDPKKRNFMDYQKITIFKPNWKELKDGLSLTSSTWEDANLLKKIQEFMQEKQHKNILLTLGGDGVLICAFKDSQFTYTHIEACRRNIADVSGAGDTVISVATLCWVLGLEVENIAMLSNLAGGLVCEEIGVVAIHKDKLMEEIQCFLA